MDDIDALGGYTVWIELDGIKSYFQECSEIKIEQEMKEHHEVVDKKLVTRWMPGPQKRHGEITLKRGSRKADDWWKWMDEVHKQNVSGARKTGALVVEDFSTGEVKRYNLEGVLPKSIKNPSFKAGQSETAVEELVLTYDWVERK